MYCRSQKTANTTAKNNRLSLFQLFNTPKKIQEANKNN